MSIDRELAALDATGQAELVRAGQVTALELVDAAIERIERANPVLNAVIHPRVERARLEAAGDLPDGPFRGVPIVLKDLGNPMAGEPHHMGNVLLRKLDHRASTDSELTRSIRNAGFVVLGRTNVPEFGLVCTTEPAAYGPTRNPWAPDRSTGGSSGGSAAAVAAGMVPIAQGTDGGGSIRMPSSHCGLVGLKPSRGRISPAPDGDGMEGHTTYGFLTRSVRDTAAALDFAAGYRPGDAFVAPPPVPGEPGAGERAAGGRYSALARQDPPPLRIGLMDVADVNGYPVDDDVRAAARDTASLLASLGHHVEESYPAAMTDPEYLRRWQELLSPSVSALFNELEALAGRPLEQDEAEEMAWWWRAAGDTISAARHTGNQAWRDAFSRRMAAWWAGGFDILVSPVLPNAAPPLGLFDQPGGLRRSVDILCFTPQFNTTGQPAISLPLGMSEQGLPVGTQLGAAYGREDLLIQLAGQLERAVPWQDRRPAVFG